MSKSMKTVDFVKSLNYIFKAILHLSVVRRTYLLLLSITCTTNILTIWDGAILCRDYFHQFVLIHSGFPYILLSCLLTGIRRL